MSDPYEVDSHAHWQQQQLEERREQERCADCIGTAGWPCNTTLRGSGKPIYLGCLKEAQARYGDAPRSSGNEYEYHGPLTMGADGKFHREMRLK